MDNPKPIADKITNTLIDENTREITETKIRRIDISGLKAQLETLRNMPQPDDKEVLALAKQGSIHPYYDKMKLYDIAYLEREINGE
jgi:hypothetical protein